MSKKLLSLTLSTLVAASSASFTTAFAANDDPNSSESDQTTVVKKDDSASAAVEEKSDITSSESSAAVEEKGNPASSVLTMTVSSDHANSDSNTKADNKLKKRKFHNAFHKKYCEDSDYSASSDDLDHLPSLPQKSLSKVFNDVYQREYSRFYHVIDCMAEGRGWVLVNKELPDSYSIGEEKRTIGLYNKYFRGFVDNTPYVMLLPTFEMIEQSRMPIEHLIKTILDPTKWEFKKFDELASDLSNKDLINSLSQYINIVTPRPKLGKYRKY